MWAGDDGSDRTLEELEWIKRDLEAKKQLRRLLERESLSHLLSESERDTEIKKLLAQLGLNTAHMEDLHRRGLTDEQIRAGQFRTVSQWQRLEIEVNHRLAGVSITGRSLTNFGSGILCPVFNPEGQIIGWQLRLDNPDDGGKYRWATSATKKRPDGPTAHLPNGELPLTYCRPIEGVKRTDSFGLTEGVGIKPYLTSQQFGQIILGASGGNFASSPETFKRYLDWASLELGGTKLIILYADAGARANPQVMRQYSLTRSLVEGWGYTLKVAWWGQLTKESPDSDELKDNECVQHITWEEFQAFFSQSEKDKFRSRQRDKEKRRYENWLKAKQGEQDFEPNLEAYATHCQQEAEFEATVAAQEAERERQSKEQYDQRVANAQRKLNTLTYPIDITLHQEYLPQELIDQIPQSGIINLKARKGGGKSTLIKHRIALWKRQKRPVISITPRIALGREQAFKWDITWIDECGVEGQYRISQMMLGEENALGLCWDSFWKVAGRDWSNAVIIIDEAELGFAHLATSSTCEDKRAFILKGFAESIQQVLSTGGLVILSDADLTNIPCDYIKALVPHASVFTVVNTHKGTAWDLEFWTGKRDEVENRVLGNLAIGLKTAVPTDSQAEAEAMERTILKHYPNARVVRIDRKTCEQDFGREFVKDPNKGIRDTKPDILIYTPSMGVGVSIEEPWFDEVVGMFFGALEPSQDRQMLARYRLPVPRIVWCADARYDIPGCKSPLPEVVKRQMLKFHSTTSLGILDLAVTLANDVAASDDDADMLRALKDTLDRLWDKDKQEWNSPHIDLYAKLKARRNFGLSQLAVQLYQELVEEGHHVTNYSGNNTAISDEIANAKEEIQLETAAAIANAEKISIETARAIKSNPNSTESDRHKAERAILQDMLPGVELSCEFVFKAVIEDRGRWLAVHRLYWMLMNPDKTKALDQKTWRYHLGKCLVYLPDVRTYSLQVKVLQDLNISRYIDSDREYCYTDSDIQQFMSRAYAMRHQINTAFNLTVTRETEPMRFLHLLLKRIGLGLGQTKRVREAKEQIRYYAVSRESLNDPDRVAVLEAFDRKYQDLELCQNPPVNINNKAVVAQPQTVATTGLEANQTPEPQTPGEPEAGHLPSPSPRHPVSKLLKHSLAHLTGFLVGQMVKWGSQLTSSPTEGTGIPTSLLVLPQRDHLSQVSAEYFGLVRRILWTCTPNTLDLY